MHCTSAITTPSGDNRCILSSLRNRLVQHSTMRGEDVESLVSEGTSGCGVAVDIGEMPAIVPDSQAVFRICSQRAARRWKPGRSKDPGGSSRAMSAGGG